MERAFFVIGALSAFVAVAAGAFGAHWLGDQMAGDLKDIFETAARYQMYHALALLAVGWAAGRWEIASVRWAGWLFVIGTAIFSGSLYILSITGLRWLGAITPIGGVALLAGWLLLAWSVAVSRHRH